MTRKISDYKKETQPFKAPRNNAREFLKALSGCDSVLDAGCGGNSPLRFYSCKRLVGVDAYQSGLDQAKENQTHDEFVLLDARKLNSHFGEKEFDACISLDLIEHLTKEDGKAFLSSLERIAKKRVIIFTPNGFLPQRNAEEGDLQEHISGWEPDEMRALGYKVIGLCGFRFLRGEYHSLRYRPKLIWGLISWLSQHLWCRHFPGSAAAILCVKELNK